jgi:hypothetical protein
VLDYGERAVRFVRLLDHGGKVVVGLAREQFPEDRSGRLRMPDEDREQHLHCPVGASVHVAGEVG